MDFIDTLIKDIGVIDLDDETEDKIELSKQWRNRWKWRHPVQSLPRPDGLVPPGGEFFTRSIYPSKEIAEQKADQQLYGFSGKAWPINMRPFLQYMGPQKVEG